MHPADMNLSPEAQKILEFVEACPYQGESVFSLACSFRDWKGYGHEVQEFQSLVRPYLRELKKAELIYYRPKGSYGKEWVATRFRSLNEEFDHFISDGKARKLLVNLKIKQIEELTRFRAKDLMKIRNCGKKTVSSIAEALEKRGLSLAPDPDQRIRIRICPHCGTAI
jgi:predicted house-cleaning noncanonical NTP pyrophosphatase (MazG superfamily)